MRRRRPSAPLTPNRLLVQTITTQRSLILQGVIGLSGHQIAEILVPVAIGAIIDDAISGGSPTRLLWWLGALALLFTSLTLTWRWGYVTSNRAYLSAEHDLRQRLVTRMLDERGGPALSSGTALSLATSDASRTAGTIWLVGAQVSAIAAIATAGITLVTASAVLTIVLIAGLPLSLWLMHKLAAPLERRSSTEQASAANATALAADLVSGIRVLQGLGAGATAAARYRSTSRALLTDRLAAAKSLAWFGAGSTVFSGLLLAVVALSAALMALGGSLSIGQVIAVVGVVQAVQWPLATVGGLAVDLAQRRASAARICEVLAAQPALTGGEMEGAASHETGESPSGRLGLWVNAADLPPFSVTPGELVGVNVTGPRAIRLLDLLGARQSAPPGEVSVDGVCASTLGPRLRTQVHAPPRDPHLFAGSLATVISPDGVPHPTLIAAALLDDVVDLMPNGLETHLPSGGSTLSGGQQDRVRLARTLHRAEPYLALHEPASAVDSVTEVALAAGLRSLREMPDRARQGVLVLTDSPVLLAACDRVVVA